MIILSSNTDLHNKVSKDFAAAWPDDIYLIDANTVPPVEAELDRCIGILDGSGPEDIIKAAITTHLSHLVQVNTPFLEEELAASCRIITNHKQFHEDPWGTVFSKKNALQGLGNFTSIFKTYDQRVVLFGELDKYLARVPRSDTIREPIVTIASELFNNVIHAQGRLQIPVHGAGKLFIIQDGERLLIGCTDPYGTLDPPKNLLRLTETYERGIADTMNMDIRKGGAGIGCRMMFDFSMSLYLGVEIGKHTTVGCVLPMGKSLRAQASTAKNLHVFKK